MVHALGTAVNTHLKQSLGVWLLSYSPSICPVTLLKFSDLDSLSRWGNWGSARLSDCLGHTTIKWPSWHLNLGLPMFKANTFDSALFCHSIVSHFTKHTPGPSFLLLFPSPLAFSYFSGGLPHGVHHQDALLIFTLKYVPVCQWTFHMCPFNEDFLHPCPTVGYPLPSLGPSWHCAREYPAPISLFWGMDQAGNITRLVGRHFSRNMGPLGPSLVFPFLLEVQFFTEWKTIQVWSWGQPIFSYSVENTIGSGRDWGRWGSTGPLWRATLTSVNLGLTWMDDKTLSWKWRFLYKIMWFFLNTSNWLNTFQHFCQPNKPPHPPPPKSIHWQTKKSAGCGCGVAIPNALIRMSEQEVSLNYPAQWLPNASPEMVTTESPEGLEKYRKKYRFWGLRALDLWTQNLWAGSWTAAVFQSSPGTADVQPGSLPVRNFLTSPMITVPWGSW